MVELGLCESKPRLCFSQSVSRPVQCSFKVAPFFHRRLSVLDEHRRGEVAAVRFQKSTTFLDTAEYTLRFPSRHSLLASAHEFATVSARFLPPACHLFFAVGHFELTVTCPSCPENKMLLVASTAEIRIRAIYYLSVRVPLSKRWGKVLSVAS